MPAPSNPDGLEMTCRSLSLDVVLRGPAYSSAAGGVAVEPPAAGSVAAEPPADPLDELRQRLEALRIEMRTSVVALQGEVAALRDQVRVLQVDVQLLEHLNQGAQ